MHGGDIYSSKIKYDFSVNVNPLGILRKVKNAIKKAIKNLVHYPDVNYGELKNVLSKKLSVDKNQLTFGNGASELISAFVRAAKTKNALLLAPSFSGYKHALDSIEAKINYFYLKEENDFEFTEKELQNFINMSKNYDTILIANPNNPNGNLIPLNIIKKIADFCESQNINLLIDECFVELTGKSDDFSFLPFLQNQKYQKVTVLRAFTKTFAIPGIRLGYSVSSINMAQKIKNQLPEWNVSVVAEEAGLACLNQKKYLEKSQKLIECERKFLSQKLSELGFKVFPSDANYILFKSEKITDLKNFLLQKKILIRDCSDYEGLEKGFYRIAVKKHNENKKLIQELKNYACGN